MRLLFLLCLATPLLAAPALPVKPNPKVEDKSEERPYPSQAWVEKGEVHLVLQMFKYVPSQQTRQVNANGKIVTEIVTVVIPVIEKVVAKVDLKTVEVQLEGKVVAAEEVPKLLTEKTDIVVMPTGTKVQAELIKAKKIVFLMKPSK